MTHQNRFGYGVLALAFLAACEVTPPEPVAELSEPLALVAGATRADTARMVRIAARELALTLSSPEARNTLFDAMRRTKVREGKLHLQRYLRHRGQALARDVGRRNRLGENGWAGRVASLPDLEIYLPFPEQRSTWKNSPDLVVAAFIESDEEIKAAGNMVTAYTLQGKEVRIPYDKKPARPVLVIYPTETAFGTTGEEPPSFDTARDLVSLTRSYDGVLPHIPYDPPPPYYPCASQNTTDTNIYICYSSIPNSSDYEGALRGAPEIAIQVRSVQLNTHGNPINPIVVACTNEDRSGSYLFNQDNDIWHGRAILAPRATVQSQQAGGRRILILVWEDDSGSKCNFNPEGITNPTNVDFDRMMDGTVILTLIGIGQGGVGGWVMASIFGGISGLLSSLGSSEDDLIGAVVLPPNVDPGSSQKDIRITNTSVRGQFKVVLD